MCPPSQVAIPANSCPGAEVRRGRSTRGGRRRGQAHRRRTPRTHRAGRRGPDRAGRWRPSALPVREESQANRLPGKASNGTGSRRQSKRPVAEPLARRRLHSTAVSHGGVSAIAVVNAPARHRGSRSRSPIAYSCHLHGNRTTFCESGISWRRGPGRRAGQRAAFRWAAGRGSSPRTGLGDLAQESEAFEDERQAVAGETARDLDLEVEVWRRRVAAVTELPQHLATANVLADVDSDRARHHVRIARRSPARRAESTRLPGRSANDGGVGLSGGV